MTADTPRGGAEFAEFLLARIAEDADRARTFLADNHEALKRAGAPWPSMALAGVERVLAECAAKRAIVEKRLTIGLPDRPIGDGQAWLSGAHEAVDAERGHILRTLAAVYADHPDYAPEWAL